MKNIHSLKRKLLVMIFGFIALFVIISLIAVATFFIDQTKSEAASHTQYWANFIAESNSNNLMNDDNETIKINLARLTHAPYINHVHIYKLNQESKKIVYFTSYNKNIDGTGIPEQSNKISELATPQISSLAIELIVPITVNSQTVGYVYLQTNTEHIQDSLNSIKGMFTIIILLFLMVALLIVMSLNSFIVSPMATMANTLKEISQQKKFSCRLEKMPYRELDILSRNINILLNRTESQLAKLSDAKQLSYEQNLELENKVDKRTQALKDSNFELLSTLEKLHQFQGQLVESEKMASLGDMVAGVAHEVNTPIGLGVTASTLLSDRLLEIKQAFDDKTLKSSQLKKFLIEGEENTAIIYRNLKRAAELIASFKKVAVDQSNEEAQTFNVKHLLDEVLLTLAPQIKNLPFVININCSNELTIKSKPGPLNQIIINLVLNSIIHGFENRENGTITILVSVTDNILNIDYQDDGKGIDLSIINKVFEPFTTTKRGSGGSGLGLHLVYNLVTQALGGEISFSSEVDKGVNFKINLPIEVVQNA